MRKNEAGVGTGGLAAYLNWIGGFSPLTAGKEKDCSREIEGARSAMMEIVRGIPPRLRREVLGPEPLIRRKRSKLLLEDMRRFFERFCACLERRNSGNQPMRRGIKCGAETIALEELAEKVAGELYKYENAWEKMVLHNLRLVVHWAKKLGDGLPRSIEDRIHNGEQGLFRAAERFNWRRGYRFSTYASRAIRDAIRSGSSDQCATIRIPKDMASTARKIQRVTQELEQRGEEATPELISSLMGISIRRINGASRLPEEPLCLESDPSNGDRQGIIDCVPDGMFPSPEELFLKREAAEEIRRQLSMLSLREELVIKLRAGIGGEDWKTQEKVGRILLVTRERVRQIEKRALKRMGVPPGLRSIDRIMSSGRKRE